MTDIQDYIDDLVCEVIIELEELCYNEPEPESKGDTTEAKGFSFLMAGWGGGFTPAFLEELVENNLELMRESFKEKYGISWDDAYEITDSGPEQGASWQDIAGEYESEWNSDDDTELTYTARVEYNSQSDNTYKVTLTCCHSNYTAFSFLTEAGMRDAEHTTQTAKQLVIELLDSKE